MEIKILNVTIAARKIVMVVRYSVVAISLFNHIYQKFLIQAINLVYNMILMVNILKIKALNLK